MTSGDDPMDDSQPYLFGEAYEEWRKEQEAIEAKQRRKEEGEE